jgi:serine/threonine-protein kinase
MLEKGAKIAHYTIEELIGHGGMGQVYKAVDVRLERRVALKVIRHAPDGDYETFTEFSARLVREAKAAAALSHPNVVAVFDVGETDDRIVYLAMEHIVGTTLREQIGRPDPVPWERRLAWLLDVARALDHAHRAGIVHRDIKPENVIIRNDGVVKVLDFGIARRTQIKVDPSSATTPEPAPSPSGARHETFITGKGTVIGTPVYMAPEQIKGAEVDARCDQFAWGVVAYELLSGERPWPKSTDLFIILANILTDPPASLRRRVPDLPIAVEETLRRAVAKTPDERFASMEEIITALEPFAKSGGVKVELSTSKEKRAEMADAYAATTRAPIVTSASQAPPPVTASEEKKKGPSVRLLYAALVVAVAMIVVMWARRPKPVVTTPSKPDAGPVVTAHAVSNVPEAAAAYADAVQLWRDGSTLKAERALLRAVDLDPMLAIAHLELALMTFARDGVDALDHFHAAYEHRALMTLRDRALLDASEPYLRAVSDPDAWADRMASLTKAYPKDHEIWFWLGVAREKQFDFELAKDAYDRALALDPSFIPALHAKAFVDRQLGNVDAALNEYDNCMRRSYVAASCYQGRFEMMRDEGECKRAADDARAWASLDKSMQAYHAVAEALAAQDAPTASVEAALAQAWNALPEKERAAAERGDRLSLALLRGDFATAERLGLEQEKELGADSDLLERAHVALQLTTIYFETGRIPEAAKVAEAFREKMSGWTPPPLGDNPSIVFVEYLYRAGRLSQAQLRDERRKWLEAEEEREGRKRRWRQAAYRWATAYAGFAENEREAKEALEVMPQFLPMPPETRRTARFNFAVGKAYALAGHLGEAEPYLQRATAACVDLSAPQIHTRAHYYLGLSLEAKKDYAGARKAYETVIARWGKAAPRSVTADLAKARLAALPKR